MVPPLPGHCREEQHRLNKGEVLHGVLRRGHCRLQVVECGDLAVRNRSGGLQPVEVMAYKEHLERFLSGVSAVNSPVSSASVLVHLHGSRPDAVQLLRPEPPHLPRVRPSVGPDGPEHCGELVEGFSLDSVGFLRHLLGCRDSFESETPKVERAWLHRDKANLVSPRGRSLSHLRPCTLQPDHKFVLPYRLDSGLDELSLHILDLHVHHRRLLEVHRQRNVVPLPVSLHVHCPNFDRPPI
mmetsp:Transcript_20732/g.41364  ORF Transcript_20732/g.41364 Transcript_20732/m.41364 type:complete len:240 (+) Transcript_20732:2065-2784(+)